MTEFTVIRFTPNPISDESINVGIAAIEEGEVLFELVPNLSRVKAFAKDVDGGSDALKNLQLFLEEFQDRADDLNRDELARVVETWTHFVQFSPLRPSKRSAEELLRQMVPVFLAARERQQRERRPRSQASTVAKRALRVALQNHFVFDQYSLERNYEIPGEITKHQYDVTLVNHAPRLGVSGISLELKTEKQVDADIDKIGYRMLDTRNVDEDFPLAVVTIGANHRPDYEAELKTMCQKMNAEYVSEGRVSAWATDFVQHQLA